MKDIITFINESMDINPNPNNWPDVKELGNGEFEGTLWGHCFVYNGQKYYSESGWLNMYPSYCIMTINEEGVFPKQKDEYQRPNLKSLFND